MTKRYADNENIQNPIKNISSMSGSKKLSALIYLLEIIMKVGKYFPVIIFSSACLNLLLAVNDFLLNNIGFAILNSLFALSGFIFLIQLHQKRKAQLYAHRYHFKDRNTQMIDAKKEEIIC
jgi:hypothetical protein